jgi:hypothetical protein
MCPKILLCHELGTQRPGKGLFLFGELLSGASPILVTSSLISLFCRLKAERKLCSRVWTTKRQEWQDDIKTFEQARCQWLMPIILNTQEAKIRRIMDEASLSK